MRTLVAAMPAKRDDTSIKIPKDLAYKIRVVVNHRTARSGKRCTAVEYVEGLIRAIVDRDYLKTLKEMQEQENGH